MLRLTNIYDNLMKKINIKNPNNIISYSIIAFIIVIIVIFLLYIRNTISLNTTTSIFGGSSNGKNCNLISRFFTSKPPLISAVDSPELSNHGLRDFYIKSAYNCCCSGKFKNDFVNICALYSCIEQGVRMLDFELYSIDNKPVVAASSINSYKTKETYKPHKENTNKGREKINENVRTKQNIETDIKDKHNNNKAKQNGNTQQYKT